jgi:hypothetical protein
MPKKATKSGRQAALRQREHKAEFSAPADSDPPIIVSGGNSVTITSKVKLTESYDGKLYTYYTSEVTVKKIKTRGKKEQDDESDNGKFRIELRD